MTPRGRESRRALRRCERRSLVLPRPPHYSLIHAAAGDSQAFSDVFDEIIRREGPFASLLMAVKRGYDSVRTARWQSAALPPAVSRRLSCVLTPFSPAPVALAQALGRPSADPFGTGTPTWLLHVPVDRRASDIHPAVESTTTAAAEASALRERARQQDEAILRLQRDAITAAADREAAHVVRSAHVVPHSADPPQRLTACLHASCALLCPSAGGVASVRSEARGGKRRGARAD